MIILQNTSKKPEKAILCIYLKEQKSRLIDSIYLCTSLIQLLINFEFRKLQKFYHPIHSLIYYIVQIPCLVKQLQRKGFFLMLILHKQPPAWLSIHSHNMYGYCLAGLAVHDGANRFIKCSNYPKTYRVSTNKVKSQDPFIYFSHFGNLLRETLIKT